MDPGCLRDNERGPWLSSRGKGRAVFYGCKRADAGLRRHSHRSARAGGVGDGAPDRRVLPGGSNRAGGGRLRADCPPVVEGVRPLNELPAAEAVALLSRREISPEELTRACLDRISAREAQVQAWQFIDPERALAQARSSEASSPPLHGLPIGIKDIIDTADLPTEYGSSIYQGYRPQADAPCVSALKRAGAVILGKTVTTQLAYFTPGKTRNPHNPEHTPGGSSSGSAAAVADFMVPAALGTQTAGSIIRPASYCGVIGFKPTFGQVPMHGIKPLAPSLDTLGVFVRNLSD